MKNQNPAPSLTRFSLLPVLGFLLLGGDIALRAENAQDSAHHGRNITLEFGEDAKLAMVWVPPGSFEMGDGSSDEDSWDDERPQTKVTFTQGFWLGKTEVTQAQWEAVMENNPSKFRGGNLPVEQVSWDDAMEFCRKLTRMASEAGALIPGYEYSLPTEAQWEYACRAGTTTPHAGELEALAWYYENSGHRTHPVGTKEANAWGFHDMHGNVSELCHDWYGQYPGGEVEDPAGTDSGWGRIYRGGDWSNTRSSLRSASRSWNLPRISNYFIGFRLALRPVAEKAADGEP